VILDISVTMTDLPLSDATTLSRAAYQLGCDLCYLCFNNLDSRLVTPQPPDGIGTVPTHFFVISLYSIFNRAKVPSPPSQQGMVSWCRWYFLTFKRRRYAQLLIVTVLYYLCFAQYNIIACTRYVGRSSLEVISRLRCLKCALAFATQGCSLRA
jgi:hypothetical protein